MIRIFIGYDPREAIAYHVLCHSIMRCASLPVSITPIMLSSLRCIHDRARDPLQSTDFTYTRFLVPYMCDYQGDAIFMDCDMLCLTDIADLWLQRPLRSALACVQHHYAPTNETKFLGQPQTRYPFKNWSSVMLFNNARCRNLTPEYVNHASGAALHQFQWLEDTQIEPLPEHWNYLIGHSTIRHGPASLVHYTQGGPWFPEYRNCEFSDEWRAELEDVLSAKEGGYSWE